MDPDYFPSMRTWLRMTTDSEARGQENWVEEKASSALSKKSAITAKRIRDSPRLSFPMGPAFASIAKKPKPKR